MRKQWGKLKQKSQANKTSVLWFYFAMWGITILKMNQYSILSTLIANPNFSLLFKGLQYQRLMVPARRGFQSNQRFPPWHPTFQVLWLQKCLPVVTNHRPSTKKKEGLKVMLRPWDYGVRKLFWNHHHYFVRWNSNS